ncbi:MAG TPA: TetR family transcriptional regulator [Actinotalea sp.]|nr:TetR family transcriptional regulator [Actinotalea sp.]
MRSVPRRPAAEDLTTRVRIRDAAIARFSADGFAVGLRAIAADAGVSAPAVLHHFGSKEGLRAACDAHVLGVVRSAKSTALGPSGPDALLLQLAALDEYAEVVGYTLRSLQHGGPLARQFVETFVTDARAYLAAGVAAGTLRPSRDEDARARYLAMQGFGTVLAHLAVDPPDDFSRLGPWLTRYLERVGLPAMELFTEGLFTDRRMLDAYLMQVPDPPPAAAPAHVPTFEST